jgi:hypothetical protein
VEEGGRRIVCSDREDWLLRKPDNGVADLCIGMRLKQKLMTLYSLSFLFSPLNMAGIAAIFRALGSR